MGWLGQIYRHVGGANAACRAATTRAIRWLTGVKSPSPTVSKIELPAVVEPAVVEAVPAGITPVHSLEAMKQLFADTEALGDDVKQISVLSGYYYAAAPTDMPIDPFSAEYRQAVVALYERLTDRRGYRPAADEILPDVRGSVGIGQPQPFGVGDSAWLGEGWVAWGFIMRLLKLKAGQKVVEFGAGFGAMALALARNGCDVTVVDIEPGYLDWIAFQARQVGAKIRTHRGCFGEIPEDSGPFDAVVFLESFHHALDHAALLARLQTMTTPDGVVCLGDEPVFEPDDYWAATVPFPWGPRLDLCSVRAGRMQGWLELGFQESYLREAMLRAGWLVEKHICPLTRRGTTWIGRKMLPAFRVFDTDLPDLPGSTWYGREATGRWTGEFAELPLPVLLGCPSVELDITNHGPTSIPVTVTTTGARDVQWIEPTQTATFRLALTPSAERLQISAPGFVPDLVLKNGDTRTLGVFVSELRFAPAPFEDGSVGLKNP